jgi:hypothetical protein
VPCVITGVKPSGHGPDGSKNYPNDLWEAALGLPAPIVFPNIPRLGPDKAPGFLLLKGVGRPAAAATDGEGGGEKLGRETQAVQQ